jgi:hypothetical protein
MLGGLRSVLSWPIIHFVILAPRWEALCSGDSISEVTYGHVLAPLLMWTLWIYPMESFPLLLLERCLCGLFGSTQWRVFPSYFWKGPSLVQFCQGCGLWDWTGDETRGGLSPITTLDVPGCFFLHIPPRTSAQIIDQMTSGLGLDSPGHRSNWETGQPFSRTFPAFSVFSSAHWLFIDIFPYIFGFSCSIISFCMPPPMPGSPKPWPTLTCNDPFKFFLPFTHLNSQDIWRGAALSLLLGRKQVMFASTW